MSPAQPLPATRKPPASWSALPWAGAEAGRALGGGGKSDLAITNHPHAPRPAAMHGASSPTLEWRSASPPAQATRGRRPRGPEDTPRLWKQRVRAPLPGEAQASSGGGRLGCRLSPPPALEGRGRGARAGEDPAAGGTPCRLRPRPSTHRLRGARWLRARRAHGPSPRPAAGTRPCANLFNLNKLPPRRGRGFSPCASLAQLTPQNGLD